MNDARDEFRLLRTTVKNALYLAENFDRASHDKGDSVLSSRFMS